MDNAMDSMDELLEQQRELEERIAELRQEKKSEAIDEVRALIKKFELSERDCGFSSHHTSASADAQESTRTRRPAKVKYRSPQGQTWTGRGRAPAWIVGVEDRTPFLVE